PAATVFHLDDPEIRVETYFLRQAHLYICFSCRRITPNKPNKQPIGRLCLVKCRLRSRTIKRARAIQPIYFYEDGARLFGATPAHRRENALDSATAQVGSHPDSGFQAHWVSVARATVTRPFTPADGRSWPQVRARNDRKSDRLPADDGRVRISRLRFVFPDHRRRLP